MLRNPAGATGDFSRMWDGSEALEISTEYCEKFGLVAYLEGGGAGGARISSGVGGHEDPFHHLGLLMPHIT